MCIYFFYFPRYCSRLTQSNLWTQLIPEKRNYWGQEYNSGCCLPGLKTQTLFWGFFQACILKWSTSKDNVKATFLVVSSGWTCLLLLEAKTSRCSIQPSSQMSCGALTLSKAMRCKEMPFFFFPLVNRKTHKEKIALFLCFTLVVKGPVNVQCCSSHFGGNGMWEGSGKPEMLTQSLDIAIIQPTLNLLCEK